jgi:hypothetical protein
MENFKKICEFMQGVTPNMVYQNERSDSKVTNKKNNYQTLTTDTDSCSIPSFLEDAYFRAQLKEATALFSKKRA